MGPRAGLDGRKISSLPGFDPEPSSPQSVTIPTELPGPRIYIYMSSVLPEENSTLYGRELLCLFHMTLNLKNRDNFIFFVGP